MRFGSFVLGVPILTVALSAQSTCATTWQPGTIPGTNSPVNACVWWDPDGPGPSAQVLVIGGDFTLAGNLVVSRIAAYDPQTAAWSTFGSGMNQSVTALCALPNGDLVAGGAFSTAGGVLCNRLARWNGSVWQPLGAGVDNRVTAVTARPNGNVVACGLFTMAGGSPVNYIAEWDGTTWGDMSGGVDYTLTAGTVAPAGVLLTLANGDVLAGGRFSRAGGVPASCVARWNGTTWAPIGNGIPQLGYAYPINPVLALAQLPNGDLVAGGLFLQAGGVAANNVARWNGTAWSAMGSGATGGFVQALTTLPSGRVMAAGHITPNNVLEWNGTSWSPVANLGGATGTFGNCLATSAGGTVGLGGEFTGLGSNVALRNGATWSSPSGGSSSGYGFDGAVLAATRRGSTLIVGGAFENIRGVFTNSLAAWNGSAWSSLGAGFIPPYPALVAQINSLLTRANGDVVAGGIFTSPASYVARWNGSTWAALGGGVNDVVGSLLETSTGDLVVGGSFTMPANHIARWNGAAWSGFGSGLNDYVQALVQMPNGDLIAGGYFTTAGGAPASRIARWNGSGWQALGSGVGGGVVALAVLADGSLVAAGQFTTAGGVPASGVARWDGTTWSAMGAGLSPSAVRCLRVLPNGDLLAGGQSLAWRWDGVGWSAVGGGINGSVYAFTDTAQGDVVAAGQYLFLGNAALALAYLTSSCPATSLAYGAGCAGLGGVDTLAADRLPWAGATFRATASGLPAQAIAFGALGFVPTATPLASLVPQGLPGCDTLVSPLSTDLLVVAGGRATMGFGIPNAPFVVGVQVLAQVLTLETDLSGGLLAATSSNGLELTIGVF